MFSKSLASLILALGALRVQGFSFNANNLVSAYWGQDAYGGTPGSNPSLWQQPIDYYCQDNSIDTFQIAFVTSYFGAGGLPTIGLANSCGGPNFPGTGLLNCQSLAANIETCQNKGRMITISLGGEGADNEFSSDAQAQAFADTLWNTFLGGSSSTRPFGGAVLDGVDLDIEAGSTTHYAAMVTQLRKHFTGASKPYYITGAPQCPFPDAYLGSVINAVGFDALYVQFYNNGCGANYFPQSFNFATWDNWAKTQSPNKNVKVFIGVPAAPQAAGQGYVTPAALATIVASTKQYSSFGGIMLWDASWAHVNNRYDAAVKALLGGSTTGSTPPPTQPSGSSVRIHPNGNTAKCLDVAGGVIANGTPVQIYDCNGTGAQNWVIASGSTSVQVAGTNFCLDAGTSPADGVPMKIWTCFAGIAAQTWTYTGDKRIALAVGECLDLTNGSTADSTIMQIWTCTNNDNNQVWTTS